MSGGLLNRSSGKRFDLLSPFFIVAAALFIILVIAPFVLTIGLAFTDSKLGAPGRFVGFANFRPLLDDPWFVAALQHSLAFGIVGAGLKCAGGYVLALLLSQSKIVGRLSGSLLLLPWLVPGSAAAIVWIWLFYEPGGAISSLTSSLVGTSPTFDWLVNPKRAFSVVVAFTVWRELPFWALVIWSGRIRIPQQLLESTSLERSSWLFRERVLVLPFLGPLLLVCFGLSFVWSFGEFVAIRLITAGGPGTATSTVAFYAYEIGYGGGVRISAAIAAMLLSLLAALFVALPPFEYARALERRR